ncbi:hypothetical protein L1887_54229 [Cichorium endivia]|nr:hypothetical protein L1887_54229 [Cichorium endivia]
MLNVCGTSVLQRASGQKTILRFGKVRSSVVVRNRSSPSSSRFFWCSVVTTLWLYSRVTSGLTMMGTPVIVGELARLDAIHGEAAGQTRHTAKDRLERLGLVVRDKVLVHLDHGDPALRLVGDARLATRAHDERIAHHAVGQRLHRLGIDHGVGVDHEAELEKVGRDAHERVHLAEEVIVERRHAIVVRDTLEEVHEDHLRVTLAAVTGLRVARLFGCTALDNDDHGRAMALCARVVTGVDHGHVVLLLALTDGNEAHGCRRAKARVCLEERDADVWSAHGFARTGDHTVGDDKEELALVRILGLGERGEGGRDAVLVLRVGGDEADDKRLATDVLNREAVGDRGRGGGVGAASTTHGLRGWRTLLVGPRRCSGRVDGGHGAVRKDIRSDLASARRTRRGSHAARHEPREPYGHEEANEDDGQDDDERAVEDEVGDEAARRDLVDVSSLVLLDETPDGFASGGVGVEHHGRVAAALEARGELLTDGEVDDVALDGSRVGSEVGRHVEHAPVEHHKVGEVAALDVLPAVADPARLVAHAVDGVGGVGGGGSATGGEVDAGGASKERRDVGAGAGGREGEERGDLCSGQMMRRGDVDGPALHAEDGAAGSDLDERLCGVACGLGAEGSVEAHGDETDEGAEEDGEEDERDLFAPRLTAHLIPETAAGAEDGAGRPKGGDEGKGGPP